MMLDALRVRYLHRMAIRQSLEGTTIGLEDKTPITA
jgi:hypothetical protein